MDNEKIMDIIIKEEFNLGRVHSFKALWKIRVVYAPG